MSASPKIAWGDSRTLKDRHVGNHIEKKWMEFRKSCRETSIAVKDNADAEDECFSKVINREVDTDWKNAQNIEQKQIPLDLADLINLVEFNNTTN